MTQGTAREAFAPPSAEGAALADAVLVERVRAGDAAAFELIMRRYNQRLYRLARSITRAGAEAEDVVQEAYLRAFERLGDFIGPDGFSSWLGTIVANEALGRLRRRGRVVSFEDYARDAGAAGGHVAPIETMSAPQPDPERLAASSELRRMLESAIDSLPDDYRVVFVLRAVEGMSVAETARHLSLRPEAVKTRLHRARRLLQRALGAQFDALMPTAFAFDGSRCDRIVASVLARLSPAFASGAAAGSDPDSTS